MKKQDNPSAVLPITELRIQNTKRIEAFAIGLDADPLILTGDNGQGKSSVIESLMHALTGKTLAEPLRRGASKGSVEVKLGDKYTLTRSFSKRDQKGSLVIKGADGKPIPSPQTFINDLLGDLNLAFDPCAFARMKPQVQAGVIRDLVGLDTSAIDATAARIYAERTEVNRAVDAARAVLSTLVKQDEPLPFTEVEQSAAELIARRDEMFQLSRDFLFAKEQHEDAVRYWNGIVRDIEELKAKLANLEVIRAEATAQVNLKAAEMESTGALVPAEDAIADIRDAITDLDANNAAIRERRAAHDKAVQSIKDYTAKEAALKEVVAKSDAKTAQLEKLKEERAAMIQNAKMPVEGMTFDDEGVFIGEDRLDQLSTAEQIRVSAMIAMQGNPDTRLMIIREGGLVNKENLKAICDAAKGRQYQVFIEKFQEQPGDVGLHIVDGHVTHVDGQPVEEEEAPKVEAVESESELKLEGGAE